MIGGVNTFFSHTDNMSKVKIGTLFENAVKSILENNEIIKIKRVGGANDKGVGLAL